jgi:hypothetical protein
MQGFGFFGFQPEPSNPTFHCGIDMLGFHQAADLVENFLPSSMFQIHCCLALIGPAVSPTVMNAAG